MVEEMLIAYYTTAVTPVHWQCSYLSFVQAIIM